MPENALSSSCSLLLPVLGSATAVVCLCMSVLIVFTCADTQTHGIFILSKYYVNGYLKTAFCTKFVGTAVKLLVIQLVGGDSYSMVIG
jgi:hypothetical protein